LNLPEKPGVTWQNLTNGDKLAYPDIS